MKSKIKTFKTLTKLLKPHCATLIGGSFTPFNSYYLRLLRWASRQSRPLVVIVHPDKFVSLRRGLTIPLENQNQRAKRVAALDFVDYVVICSKVAHNPMCLRLIKPKFVIFQHDNVRYHKELFKEISHNFPEIQIKVAPFKRKVNIHSAIVNLSLKNKFLKNKKNKIYYKKLLSLAQKSRARVGKISALLVKKGKIVAGAANSRKEEHAEILLLKKIRLKKNFNEYSLYTLIPPCIMCAKAIIRSNIKKVYYLFNYGDKMGINYLKKRGVTVKQFR